MRAAVHLPNVHDIVFVFDRRSFVVVYIEVVWCREDCHEGGKACCTPFAVHSVSGGMVVGVRVR